MLLWENPLVETDEDKPVPSMDLEFYDPSYLFRAEDDSKLVNPMHLYTEPFGHVKSQLDDFKKAGFDREFGFIYDDL